MDRIIITADSGADDFEALALCIQNLIGGLPVTARSRNTPGIQIEDGKVRSKDYTGPLLERSIVEGHPIKDKPPSGTYKGIPVAVAPVLVNGTAIAAFGIVDTSGALGIKDLMDQYASLHRQVSGK